MLTFKKEFKKQLECNENFLVFKKKFKHLEIKNYQFHEKFYTDEIKKLKKNK
jgi:hypothetical protein